jgi:hypothetical protein
MRAHSAATDTEVEPLDASEAASVAQILLASWFTGGRIDFATWNVLQAVPLYVIDLPSSLLGVARDGAIYIDVDAAGHGWFVDSTALRNEEFSSGSGAILESLPGSRAAETIDLVSVLTHEYGHLLGLKHGETATMAPVIGTGERLTSSLAPTTHEHGSRHRGWHHASWFRLWHEHLSP